MGKKSIKDSRMARLRLESRHFRLAVAPSVPGTSVSETAPLLDVDVAAAPEGFHPSVYRIDVDGA